MAAVYVYCLVFDETGLVGHVLFLFLFFFFIWKSSISIGWVSCITGVPMALKSRLLDAGWAGAREIAAMNDDPSRTIFVPIHIQVIEVSPFSVVFSMMHNRRTCEMRPLHALTDKMRRDIRCARRDGAAVRVHIYSARFRRTRNPINMRSAWYPGASAAGTQKVLSLWHE